MLSSTCMQAHKDLLCVSSPVLNHLLESTAASQLPVSPILFYADCLSLWYMATPGQSWGRQVAIATQRASHHSLSVVSVSSRLLSLLCA
jgi:hypothetical protein